MTDRLTVHFVQSLTRRLPDILSWLLLALALLLLVWRFIDIGDAAFGFDEPQILDAARRQLRSGTVATSSPLLNSSGVPYGPTALWFYGAVQAVFGYSPYVAIVAMGLVTTGAQVIFCVALTRATRPDPSQSLLQVLDPRGRWTLGPLLLLVASSPQLHLWSRTAWDNQLTTVAGLLCSAALLSVHHPTPLVLSTVGMTLGLGLATHPMLLPFAVLTSVVLVLRPPVTGLGEVMRRGLWLGVPVLAILAPWLWHTWQSRGGVSTMLGRGVLEPSLLLAPFQTLGTRSLPSYLADSNVAPFAQSVGPPGTFAATRLFQALAWPALGIGGLLLGLHARPTVRQVSMVALALVGVWPIVLGLMGLTGDPHYFSPLVWAPLAGVGLFLSSSDPWRRLAVLLALLVAASQLVVLVAWRDWLHVHDGTRDPRYGLSLDAQVEAVDLACSTTVGDILLVIDVVSFPDSFAYLASVSTICDERNVRTCRDWSGCPEPDPDETVVRVAYGDDGGLVVSPTA